MKKTYTIPNGIDPRADFHTLSSSQVELLVYAARDAGYRKPKSANGSTARYFFAAAVRQWESNRQ